MKILISGPRFHANYNGMIQGLEEAGHEVHFLSLFDDFKYINSLKTQCHYNKHYIEFPSNLNFGFLKKRLPPNWRFLPSPFGIRKVIKNINPDLVIARDISFQTIIIKLFLQKRRKFLLYNLWDINLEEKKLSLFTKVLMRLFFYNQHRITPIFNISKYNVALSKGNVHAFYFPVINVPSAEQSYLNPIRFLCVSKLDQKRKNLEMLVDSLLPFLESYEATLHIIGTVRNKQDSTYLKLIEKTKNIKGISIEENLPYIECLERYKNFDFFILPAESEPLGYSILEAWSAGLPVLISNDGGLSSQIKEGETGFLFESNNKRSLQIKLAYIINRKNLIPEMRLKSLETINHRYQPSDFEKRIIEIYDKIN